MDFEFVDKCKAKLKPLGVKVSIDIIDDCYYATFDGTKSLMKTRWVELFGISFGQIAMRTLIEFHSALDVEEPADNIAVFKIGTLFDILSKQHEQTL
jgi:hypothetical protein